MLTLCGIVTLPCPSHTPCGTMYVHHTGTSKFIQLTRRFLCWFGVVHELCAFCRELNANIRHNLVTNSMASSSKISFNSSTNSCGFAWLASFAYRTHVTRTSRAMWGWNSSRTIQTNSPKQSPPTLEVLRPCTQRFAELAMAEFC